MSNGNRAGLIGRAFDPVGHALTVQPERDRRIRLPLDEDSKAIYTTRRLIGA